MVPSLSMTKWAQVWGSSCSSESGWSVANVLMADCASALSV